MLFLYTVPEPEPTPEPDTTVPPDEFTTGTIGLKTTTTSNIDDQNNHDSKKCLFQFHIRIS